MLPFRLRLARPGPLLLAAALLVVQIGVPGHLAAHAPDETAQECFVCHAAAPCKHGAGPPPLLAAAPSAPNALAPLAMRTAVVRCPTTDQHARAPPANS